MLPCFFGITLLAAVGCHADGGAILARQSIKGLGRRQGFWSKIPKLGGRRETAFRVSSSHRNRQRETTILICVLYLGHAERQRYCLSPS
jgi:hypothetical protein